MQPVYRFSLLSGKVSIIDGFGNDIALPVIQRADRNIMHTQLPQIVQRYVQKQAQLHANNTPMRYNCDILLVALTLEDIVKSRPTTTRYIMKALALWRNPFARTRQEIISLGQRRLISAYSRPSQAPKLTSCSKSSG